MKAFNIHEAKTHFSKLVDQAVKGETFVIAKAGKPRARLVPLRQSSRRRPGRAKGKIWIAADFDSPLPDALAEAFAGSDS